MNTSAQPLERRELAAEELFERHPPVLRNPNKKAVLDVACPPGTTHGGRIVYSRWAAMRLPGTFAPGLAASQVERVDGFYDYRPVLREPGAVEWHVNFADPNLFFAYGSFLFAQDEMQVAEHPILGCLREALQAEGAAALTVEKGSPTPVLVQGVERRCRVATDRNPGKGRPMGLYGNEFGSATAEAVRRATTRVDPPTLTNLVAMAAPSGGRGVYTAEQVGHILVTCFTSFRAAVLESGAGPVAVHTGFWGCGAFGGNRILMTLLQAVAAGAAGVDRLVVHAPGETGAAAVESARSAIREHLADEALELPELVRRIVAIGYEWGVSDGN